ncbi:MAG: type II toxin-antitoxin system RelE/ParE family toxin [Rhodobacteraceae bacterium]|nr:type II toxin-antitoxin system RelE/ParE family toxin [Paracoccaceae bacterium]
MSGWRLFAHLRSDRLRVSSGIFGCGQKVVSPGGYVTAAGRRVAVLHVFVKKWQKTPRRALATAQE